MATDFLNGRAAAPGPSGPPPADLAALLGLGGGAPGAPAPAPPETQQNPADIVSNMLDLASQYAQAEQDEEDKLVMEKISTQLQQLLAKDQADADKAMQGNMSPRTLRKALG